MTVDKAQFRLDFPEFISLVTFPDSAVTFWLNTAYLMLRPERWSTLIDLGAELFTAHNLVLEAAAQRSANIGALPGLQGGVVSAKAVDRVSISYDAQAGLELGAGHWNLTIYGTRFVRYSRMAGTGGLQIGAGCDLAGVPLGGWGPFEGW